MKRHASWDRLNDRTDIVRRPLWLGFDRPDDARTCEEWTCRMTVTAKLKHRRTSSYTHGRQPGNTAPFGENYFVPILFLVRVTDPCAHLTTSLLNSPFNEFYAIIRVQIDMKFGRELEKMKLPMSTELYYLFCAFQAFAGVKMTLSGI